MNVQHRVSADDIPRSEMLLSPTQQRAYDELCEYSAAAPIVVLQGMPGLGKSTIARRFAATVGGELLSLADFVRQVSTRDMRASEESVRMLIEAAMERAEVVVVDELAVLSEYGGRSWADRIAGFQLDCLLSKALETGARLVFTARPETVATFARSGSRIQVCALDPFGARDYRAICGNLLPRSDLSGLDFDQLHSRFGLLQGHDLHNLCALIASDPTPTTARMVEVLCADIIKSNTATHEVEQLRFEDLPGTEHIAHKIETSILLPLENLDLATRLNLKPKRGVLLYGPPGTGKTSIGRALAHRMQGKFYLIDGSFITEPPTHFFSKIRAIVREAKENAPSVLFVDDADVLFGIDHIAGLPRFLLSLLDGVESETANKICLVMTAMNASRIPGSILRSGRVELWLETHLPDREVRSRILRKWLGRDLPDVDQVRLDVVAAATERFTQADLRRIVGDAKALYAAHVLTKRSLFSATDYLLRAVADLKTTRDRMADNLRDESLRIRVLSDPADKYGTGIGGLVESGAACEIKGW